KEIKYFQRNLQTISPDNKYAMIQGGMRESQTQQTIKGTVLLPPPEKQTVTVFDLRIVVGTYFSRHYLLFDRNT
ncbi:hypothetical protein M1N01_01560, partial [Thermodesulfovibrionales bacterium]|nr:hypothetical protein [Thermodesulfovibrionales bacterium]